MSERILDIENIGRIGLMFIDGDLLADVLIDPLTCDEDDTDYNIPAFNELKKALSKIERINPDLYLTGVIWQAYPRNKRMATPAVAGRSLPKTGSGWMITDCPAPLSDAMREDKITSVTEGNKKVFYFPIKTSAGRVSGALELAEGNDPGLFERNYTFA